VRWEEFFITLGPMDGEGLCHVRADSPLGQARTSFRIGDLEQEVGPAHFSRSLGSDEQAATDPECVVRAAASKWAAELREIARRPRRPFEPRAVGSRLFDVVFSGRCRDLFHLTESLATATRSGLRIVLAFDPQEGGAAWLQSLPWELLHQTSRLGFIALRDRRSIVRHLDLVQPVVAQRLPSSRVLIVRSLPDGLGHLDLPLEEANLEASWRGGSLKVLRNASLAEAEEFIRTTGPYQIFHYMGHAGFVDGVGTLSFSDGHGGVDAVDGKRLTLALAAQGRPFSLVFLNACRTGQPGTGGDLFAGLATALALEVPVVLAMREAILDREAIEFSGGVHQALAGGRTLDEAVHAGRRQISSGGWWQPVLLQRFSRSSLAAPSKSLLISFYSLLFELPSSLQRVGVWGSLLAGLLAGMLALSALAIAQALAPTEIPAVASLSLLGLASVVGGALGRARLAYDIRPLALCAALLMALIGARPLVPRRVDQPLASFGNLSGWMSEKMPPDRWLDFAPAQQGCRSESCLRFTYHPGGGFAGIYWFPWGCDQVGPDCGINLLASEATRIRRVSFYARGEHGGEALEFKVGGEDFPPTPGRRRNVILTKDWQRYTLELEGVDLHEVVGLFAWFAADIHHREDMTFYLDEIVFEGVFCPLDRR
jgi:hypothetical protein